jgi:predicted O-methyltransferase YrrM
MDFARAVAVLDGIQYTSPDKGRFFYDFVLKHRPKRVLELGFAHGVSTCYFAAALDEIGGTIDCVDLDLKFEPDVETLSMRLDLSNITPHRETSSYTWFLKKEIERHSRDDVCEPQYDLVFIDGPKDWTNDGAAFFMADKLLRRGGWMMFDDYSWTYRDFGKTRGYIFPEMSEEEMREPQIKAVVELLVMQHPSYSEFEIMDEVLALARKVASDTKTVRKTTRWTPSFLLKKAVRTLR